MSKHARDMFGSRSSSLSRRRLLATAGVGTGAYLLRDLFAPGAAHAEPKSKAELPFLVFAYFSGGWDVVSCLDPRSAVDYPVGNGGVESAYELVADAGTAAALGETSGTGVYPHGNLTFGPAVPLVLREQYEDLCVVRGMNMGTLTHEVGRRYMITGKFPRGLAASGSALPTVVAAVEPDLMAIPNLVIGGVETYNEGLTPKASGLNIASYDDLAVVLKPIDETKGVGGLTDQAIAAYHDRDHCIHRQLAPDGALEAYRAGWQKARVLMEGTLWQHFNFTRTPTPAIETLYDAFQVPYANQAQLNAALTGSKGQALIAAQALQTGVSQVVSIRPAQGLDTHDDNWTTDHLPRLRDGFESIGLLLRYLKSTADPDNPNRSMFDRTIVVCFSEFARTPKLNVREGRDHHLDSACLVAGAGIAGNTVIGATTDDTFSGRPIDPQSGALDPGGIVPRPADVHATVLTAMGLGIEQISNQDPIILDRMLKG